MNEVLEGRILNAEPSPPDPKDIPFLGNTARGLPAAVIKPSFRHSGKDWPVLDQHATGTCGGQAGTGLRQWQELHDTHDLPKIKKFSAFGLYDLCLKAEGKSDPNHERMLPLFAKTVMTVLRDKGTPLSSRAGAFAGKLASFEKMEGQDLSEEVVKEAIKTWGVVLVRLDWDKAWTETGLLPGRILPDPIGEKGGHIFVLFGWDDDVNHGSFLMRNTWGNWAPKRGTSPTTKLAGPGNAYMRYDFFLNPARRAEVWVSVDVLKGPV
jgi:hypothetical protein